MPAHVSCECPCLCECGLGVSCISVGCVGCGGGLGGVPEPPEARVVHVCTCVRVCIYLVCTHMYMSGCFGSVSAAGWLPGVRAEFLGDGCWVAGPRQCRGSCFCPGAMKREALAGSVWGDWV